LFSEARLCAGELEENLSRLDSMLASVLAASFSNNGGRIRELADPLTEDEFWKKPFGYGNSFGHLVLHLTGNLNYYIGAQMAETGYIRDRPREFSESNPPSKEIALQGLDDAVAMVKSTVGEQTAEGWSKEYSAERTNCRTRLEMVLQCAAHMQHHIGQMIYLVSEWKKPPRA